MASTSKVSEILDFLSLDSITDPYLVPSFISKSDLGEKVKVVYEFFRNRKQLVLPPTLPKSDLLSEMYIGHGDAYFQKQNKKEAIRKYNRALACSIPDKDTVSQVYASRSKVLFSLKKYNDCIIDIARAIENEIDEERVPKLLKRFAACQKMIPSEIADEVKATRKQVFVAPLEFNQYIPCASSSIDIDYTCQYGRHLIATEDIPSGRLVAMEQPYSPMLHKEFLVTRCSYCCEHNDAMIACDGCTLAMFCDEQCKNRAREEYHEFECRMLHIIYGMGFSTSELLALRNVLKAWCEKGSWEELDKAAKKAESVEDCRKRGFARLTPDSLEVLDSRNYEAIHMFDSHENKLTVHGMLQKAAIATMFLFILDATTPIFNNSPEDGKALSNTEKNNNILIAGRLLLINLIKTSEFMYNLEAIGEDSAGDYLNRYRFATGSFGLIGLLNHSCAPNVHLVSVGTTLYCMTMRPIKSGQQLFGNYGPHYTDQEYSIRQLKCSKLYFTCHCEACDRGWPLYADLKPGGPSKKKKGKKGKDMLSSSALVVKLVKGDNKEAISMLVDMYKRVDFLENHLPCKEQVDYLKAIKQTWELLGNIIHLDDLALCDKHMNHL